MPVAGLVLSLTEDPSLRDDALRALAALPGLTLGEVEGATVPAVTEADALPAQDALWADIQGTEGVTAVALVCLNTEDVDAFDVPARRLRRPTPEASGHGP
jgi:hypothetical protein